MQVKTLRNKAKMTQKELADKIGVSREHLSLIENGKQSNVTLNVLVAMAKTLDVNLDELVFGGTDTEPTYNKVEIEIR